MSVHWERKAPSDIVERVWTPKEGEAVSSRTLAVSVGSATLTSEIQGDSLVVTVTGGVNGVTQVVAASAVLGNGETITATIYIPVTVSANALAQTGQDIARFALRKITGNDSDPEATEVDDALERLTDMLAAWSGQGADLGIPLPITTATVFYCSDAHISAIKNNLVLQVADLYDFEPSAIVAMNAQRGLQQIKTALLSKERGTEVYY